MIENIEKLSDWIWGPPMVILLVIGGIFLTVRLGIFQFRYVGYIFKQTIGSLFTKNRDKNKTKGTITPFQALTSVLASTIVVGNITGVAVDIMFVGHDANFLMWVIDFFAVSIKFSEVELAVHYH